jgi:hypothetical protein
MSLHFGPVLVLTGSPRPFKVCVKAQDKGSIMVNGYWQNGCSNPAVKMQDICIAQHNDVTIQIDMLDQEENPLDISGFTSFTWIVATRVDGAILLTKSTTSGGISLPSATRAVVSITNTETGALPARRLYHELRGINSGGEYQTMLAGSFWVQDTRISDA